MPSFVSRYATPFITGLFLVSLISGVALFFHWGSAYFHGMHEWLSMVLILPFVLHIWKNWRAFVSYFKRVPMAIALVVSVAGGLVFVVPALTSSSQRGGPPQRAVFQAMENGTLTTLAPLFGHDPDSLAAALQMKGLTVSGPDDTVRTIAATSGASPGAVIGDIASVRK